MKGDGLRAVAGITALLEYSGCHFEQFKWRCRVSLNVDGSALKIFVRKSEGGDKLLVEVHSPALGHEGADFGQIDLSGNLQALAQTGVGKRLDTLPDLAATSEGRAQEAQAKCDAVALALFRILPAKLRELLWRHKDENLTLQILSDDPYLPWEVVKLEGPERQEGPYLVEAYLLTRWLRQVPLPPSALRLPLQRVVSVVPKASGLELARSEEEELIKLFGSDRLQPLEPTFAAVLAAFKTEDFDGWHFSGHGSPAGRDPSSATFMLDEDGELTPDDLEAHGQKLREVQPLIFFNGCYTGQVGFALAGLGGWAQASLKVGASAFIGTLWAVQDSRAPVFARAFYEAFLAGQPIAEAVRSARRQLRDAFPGDPTWLAYTVYAHPRAVCADHPAGRSRPNAGPALLRLPQEEWRADVSSPGMLLRAEYRVVPFHGRDEEIADLEAWAVDESPFGVRLYTGEGGMGKTRLAIELAQRLRREGWWAGFLHTEDVRQASDLDALFQRPGSRVLVIVDYAESRRDLLVPLAKRLRRVGEGPVRLLLLARAAIDWWEQLKREVDGVGEVFSGPKTSRLRLKPLALQVEQRQESYRLAGEAFATKLGLTFPALDLEDPEAEYFERVLLLHMAAYVVLMGKEAAKSDDDILDEMLRHEVRYWQRRAVDERSLPPTLVPAIQRAMALITLLDGAASESEAVEKLRQLQAFEGHTGDVLQQVAHLLHESYPSPHRWIEKLLPDLFGDHLVRRELERGGDELIDLTFGVAEL